MKALSLSKKTWVWLRFLARRWRDLVRMSRDISLRAAQVSSRLVERTSEEMSTKKEVEELPVRVLALAELTCREDCEWLIDLGAE